jgi:two-component system nitrogen regulation sensor histidine kinase NtrY
MASSSSGAGFKSKKPHRNRFAFEVRIKLLSTLLCVPSLVLCGLLLWNEHASLTAVIGLLVMAGLGLLLLISTLMEQIIRPLQTLANVVNALREEDYSFRARGAKQYDSLGELAMEINALADTLQSQRLSALEATALLRRVIAEMDAPVLAFDSDNVLRLLNPASARVLSLNVNRDLGRPATALGLNQLLSQPDEGILMLENHGQTTRWMVRRSTFRQRGVPHELLMLSDVSSVLREEERTAWRRLIRVLGHEISNSLAPIKSIAGSLRSRLPATAGAPSDFDRGLTVIESRAESLNRFVQAYRQLAQLPAPTLRRVPLGPLLERVASLETRLEVELLPAPPVDLLADADQLEQLLINLVRNAVEAALTMWEEAEGPVNRDDAEVTIRVTQKDDSVLILIEDTGPGLTNPGNLFVPFYTTKKSGTGVGLVLARQIAEAHGGTLELRNRTDRSGCQAEVRVRMAARISEPQVPASPRQQILNQ